VDGRTDVRTYVRTDGRTFETGFIRSTLSKSRAKNYGPKYYKSNKYDIYLSVYLQHNSTETCNRTKYYFFKSKLRKFQQNI